VNDFDALEHYWYFFQPPQADTNTARIIKALGDRLVRYLLAAPERPELSEVVAAADPRVIRALDGMSSSVLTEYSTWTPWPIF